MLYINDMHCPKSKSLFSTKAVCVWTVGSIKNAFGEWGLLLPQVDRTQ